MTLPPWRIGRTSPGPIPTFSRAPGSGLHLLRKMRVRVCEERGCRCPLATSPPPRAARAATVPTIEAEVSIRSEDVHGRKGCSSNARARTPHSDPCTGAQVRGSAVSTRML